MADITMTQIPGTTHHYTASIDVVVANLEPTLDLKNALNIAGGPILVPSAITEELGDNLDASGNPSVLDATFEAQSAFVTSTTFKSGSFDPAALTIQLVITTTGIDETNAILLKFEFLPSSTR